MAATMMQAETHPWLKWSGCDKDRKIELNNKLAELQHRGLCPPRFMDSNVTNQLGITEVLKQRLKTVHRHGVGETVDIPAWERALNVKEQVFREWVLEFYCSLEVDKKNLDNLGFSRKKRISFRLGGQEHNISVSEFGVLCGIFTSEEVEENLFEYYLKACELNSKELEVHAAWNALTGISRHTGTSKASSIRSPMLRVIHKMLIHSFMHRATQHDKVYVDDLWLLHTFDQERVNKYVCVPWVLVCFMESKGAGRQKDSQMCCGHFITRMVKNLGLFTAASVRACSAPVDFRLITMQELETSKLVNRARNGLIGEPVVEAEEEEMEVDPTEGTSRGRKNFQRDMMGTMKILAKGMSNLGKGMKRMETKVDYAYTDYQYHMGRYQPYLEHMASQHASSSGAQWPEYAPPPRYMTPEEEEESDDEEGDEEDDEQEE